MPDSSILITAQDRYSDAVSKMASITKSFSKDADEMQTILNRLSGQKTTLQFDAEKARQELKTLEKQFLATGSAQDKLAMEAAGQKYENIRRNLALVTKGASEAERQMQKTGEAFRKAGNQPGVGFSSIVSTVATAGALQLLGNASLGATNTLIGSAAGSEAGGMISSAISSAISGAAIGSIIPGIGTAVGAAIGAGAGLITGGAAVYGKQDDVFKSYVQDAYNRVTEERASSLSAGSAIAAGRETTMTSFTTLFGGAEKAQAYFEDLIEFAAKTPFAFDELTSISKTLKTFNYATEEMIPTLRKVGDAGAALGLSSSDVSLAATFIGRMRSSDKATLEYLNPLNERGFSVFQWIADDLDTTIADVYDKISKGKLSGTYVSDLILKQFDELYGGMMDVQSRTYAGMVSTLEDAQTELDNAMGVGYNEERKKGIAAETDFLSGETGEAMQEAYKSIGAWQADLENQKEEYIRNAIQAAMETDKYIAAKQAGDAVTMGRIIMEAKIHGINEYNAGPGAQEQLASDLALIESIRDDAALNKAYWDAGHKLGLEFSKGRAAGMNGISVQRAAEIDRIYAGYDNYTLRPGYAVGLPRVPYDNFPALLHEGERVLTAREARAADRNSGSVHVTITGNTFGGSMTPEEVGRAVVAEINRALILAAPAS